MNRIVISGEHDPCFNLALEEELLFQADAGTMLYLWVNRPCVVLGRNQNPYLECDMDYLNGHQIGLVRRKSGGGAVYQDPGNLNYTFINREGEGQPELQRRVLLEMIRELGVTAEYSGRNDILVNGRKVSGQAGYCENGNEYLHGTLMIRVNTVHLAHSLRPSKMKLESKGVRSVESRVVNLSEFMEDLDVEQVKMLLIRHFIRIYGPSQPPVLRTAVQGKPKGQSLYESRAWIVDSCPEYTAEMEFPFRDGLLKLRLQVKKGIIVRVQGSCDSLTGRDISWIEEMLNGCRPDREQIIKIITERGMNDECI